AEICAKIVEMPKQMTRIRYPPTPTRHQSMMLFKVAVRLMNRSRISYTAQNGTKPPATLKMAHKTERVIFPLQGPAKEKSVLTQCSFCCFISIHLSRSI